MSNCTHELYEREVACADGICPLCLVAQLADAVATLRDIAHAHDSKATRLRFLAADALIRFNTTDSAPAALYESFPAHRFIPCNPDLDDSGICHECGREPDHPIHNAVTVKPAL